MMSSIGMVEAGMPPGFRFHPRDDELVLDYLLHKLTGRRAAAAVAILDVDLNKCEPWDLPEAACVGGKEWYFYSLRDRKYATGQRTNRATRSGYWKATGKDRAISRRAGGDQEAAPLPVAVGMRKTLVFYRGRAPRGRKTEWVMHEFRLQPHHYHTLKEDWVLCRVFYKSRTTTPMPSSEETGTLSNELDLPDVPSLLPLVDSYFAFDDSAPITTTTIRSCEQVSCFSGMPALPFKGSVSFGDTPKLEFSPNWGQESVLSQIMWNPI